MKKNPLHPTKNLKEKKSLQFEPIHWLDEISISKTVRRHFGLG
jgi:hypothetical protein